MVSKVHTDCQRDDVAPQDVMKLVLKYLDLEKVFPMVTTYVSRTPYGTRLIVWEFWHQVSDESTWLQSWLDCEYLRRPACQKDLEYSSTVRIVTKRNREFYQSIWKTHSAPIVILYKKFHRDHAANIVSMGLILNLRPFYIRNVSLKDIEMCCCKLHLHGGWSVIAIIRIAAKFEIQLPFTDYSSFFSLLYADCGDITETYIPWECTPNKKEVCDDIMRNFSPIMNLLPTADEKTTIAFTQFQKQVQYDSDRQMIMNKKKKPVEKLVAVKEQVNAKFLVEFTRNLLPNIIHHRNILTLYRNIKGTFLDIMQCVYMDADFSENLTIGVKQEPQSLHWTKHQVTVHPGIVKYSQEKAYHPYFSNSRVDDQPIAHQALREMISWTDIPDGTHNREW